MTIPKTIAGRMELALSLLGGQPTRDYNGDILLDENGKVILTPKLISEEDARRILDFKDETDLEKV